MNAIYDQKNVAPMIEWFESKLGSHVSFQYPGVGVVEHPGDKQTYLADYLDAHKDVSPEHAHYEAAAKSSGRLKDFAAANGIAYFQDSSQKL